MEDISSDLCWTLSQYPQECGGTTDVAGFGAMAVAGKNYVVNDWNNFQRDTVLGAWKRRWVDLRSWRVFGAYCSEKDRFDELESVISIPVQFCCCDDYCSSGRKASESKRSPYEDTVLDAASPKAVPKYVEKI